jgi:hypothetical protein
MSYARLGESCQTSMHVLTDNRKFFTLNDPVYNMFYTKAYRLPASNPPLLAVSEDTRYPEDIKTARLKLPEGNGYNGCSSCRK